MRFPRVRGFLSLEFVFEKKQTNSLTPLCDFPGYLYFQVLNLCLKKIQTNSLFYAIFQDSQNKWFLDWNGRNMKKSNKLKNSH